MTRGPDRDPGGDDASEPPLTVPLDAMLASGRIAIDAMARRLADPGSGPVLRRSTADEVRRRWPAAAPEEPTDLLDVLHTVIDEVTPLASRTDHPGYFAFIPSFTTWPAVLADLIAAATNPYVGSWMEAAGPTRIELDVIGWFRQWLGLPETAGGLLVSGGSAANLTALTVARDHATAAGADLTRLVVYTSDQGHSSLARTAHTLGFSAEQVRILPSDGNWRLRPELLSAAVAADRSAGRQPVIVCATAGTTNTGSVDPLAAVADVCRAERLWLHVDAAYGGFAALTDRGGRLLDGIGAADSITVDPHKWLFQPMECGAVLCRDAQLLERSFGVHPDYLADAQASGDGEVDLADRGLQLSRGFRALKVWMSVQTYGVAAFRAAIDRNLDLAAQAARLVEQAPGLELVAAAGLGIVCFRRTWPDLDEEIIAARNQDLADQLERGGRALVSPTRLHGVYAVRLCVLNPTSRLSDVAAVIDHFATGHASPTARRRIHDRHEPIGAAVTGRSSARPHDGRTGDGRTGEGLPGEAAGEELFDRLRRIPLFRELSAAAVTAIAASGALVTVPAGEPVVSRWDTDRFFYVILDGAVEVVIDGQVVNQLKVGDFFGELAARDWGNGYGYARLATVRTTTPSALLLVPGSTLAAVLAAEPVLRRAIDAAIRDRLTRT